MTKRKLSKLLNKETEFTAILKHTSDLESGWRVMLQDVRHKGKIYSDHSWVRRTPITEKIPYDTEISFTATPYMYNDKHGVRKQGLKHCKYFQIVNKDYDNQKAIELHNKLNLEKRKGNYS